MGSVCLSLPGRTQGDARESPQHDGQLPLEAKHRPVPAGLAGLEVCASSESEWDVNTEAGTPFRYCQSFLNHQLVIITTGYNLWEQ